MQTKTMSTLHYLHKYSILKYIQTHTNIYIYKQRQIGRMSKDVVDQRQCLYNHHL